MFAGRSFIYLSFAAILFNADLVQSQTHKGIHFQAKIKRHDGTFPSQSGTPVNLKILSSNNCILKEESLSNVNISSGSFSLVVGVNTLTGSDPNKSMVEVMDNSKTVTGLTCLEADGTVLTTNGSYVPSGTDDRILRLSFEIGSDPIVADFRMKSVAFAVNAESLNGKTESQFLNVNESQQVTQENIESILSRFTKLDAIINSYNTSGSTISADISGHANSATTAVTATSATNVTGVVAIANGGTGATTAAGARTNLELGPLASMAVSGSGSNTTFLRGDGTWVAPSSTPVGTTAGTVAAGDDARIVASVQKDGSVAMTGDLNFNNRKAVNLAAPTSDADAATKQYVDAAGTSSNGGRYTISCAGPYNMSPICIRMDTVTGATDCVYGNSMTYSSWVPCTPPFGGGSPSGEGDFKIGYFVATLNVYPANFGGLTGANSTCLNELTSYPWNGKSDAQSRGILVASKVKAFLCDSTTCNDGVPFTKYQFATVGSSASGGATLLTNVNGVGPGESTTAWSSAGNFGTSFNIWTGRTGFPGNTANYFGSGGPHCSNWSSTSSSVGGNFGSTGSFNHNRWCQDDGYGSCYNNSTSCSSSYRLVCWVHP